MAQLSDDCFAFGGALLGVDAALALIEARIVPVVEEESVPLADAAGRILARDAVDVPPHANSAVDGYALAHADLSPDRETVMPVAGRAAAGHPLGRPAARGEAIRIFTGAPMPDGTDTVMMQEDCVVEEGGVTGGSVRLQPGIKKGANRRHAGEDVAQGSIALPAGRRLKPADLGLAAALGNDTVLVFRPLRAALLSTGDEVCEPGTTLSAGMIYDANRVMLRALLRGLGCIVSDLGINPDRADSLGDTLAAAAAGHDLIVTSGGVSTGEEDHVRAAIEKLGRLDFWRLAIKPGRPVALGQLNGVPLIGLPGNPVSSLVTFLLFGRPALQALAGESPQRARTVATLDEDCERERSRVQAVRCRIELHPDGWHAITTGPQSSHILTSLLGADAFAIVPAGDGVLAAGAQVHICDINEAFLATWLETRLSKNEILKLYLDRAYLGGGERRANEQKGRAA